MTDHKQSQINGKIREWQLFERLKDCLFREAVEEINTRRRIAVKLNELVLTAPLYGMMFGSEPGQILAVDYSAKMENDSVRWQYNDGPSWQSFLLNNYFKKEEIPGLIEAAEKFSDFHFRSPWMKRLAERVLASHPEIVPEDEPDILISREELADVTHSFYSKPPLSADFLHDLFIAVSSVCPLNGKNYAAIGCSLHYRYQNVDLIHLSNESLKEMILELPNFRGSADELDSRLLGAAITQWIYVRDGGDGDDDMRWDPYA